MALSDFTVRVSGTVAYDDDSHGSFESSAIFRGNLGGVVASHNSVDSLDHFQQLYNNMSVNVDSMFALLPGTVTLTPATPTSPKTVSSFVMEISGLITEDDDTKQSFVAQWVNGTVDLFPSETDSAWTLLVGTSAANSFLTQILETLAGIGNATVTAP